jgi:hypothetical protein
VRQPPLLEAFTAWLSRFGDSWEAADADAMVADFGPAASLQATPFAAPVRGGEPIADYWRRELADVTDVHFSAQVLGAGDTYGIAHWRVAFSRGDVPWTRDGILLAALDARGRCASLRMWWHEERVPAISSSEARDD